MRVLLVVLSICNSFKHESGKIKNRPQYTKTAGLLTNKDNPIIDYTKWAYELCIEFYIEHRGATKVSLIENSHVANGGQSTIFKCSTSEDGIHPQVAASKVFYTTADKNMTELGIINTELSNAGVRYPLYWFHDNGFFEEFLDGKSDLWGAHVNIANPIIRRQSAKELARVHSVAIDSIQQTRYTKAYEGWWNTREINSHFDVLQFAYGGDVIVEFIKLMGWTYEEFRFEVDWTEKLIRNYHNDSEIPVLCHNDPHPGNMMIDDDDYTGDSFVLIDYDNANYGYRAFDWAYHIGYMGFFFMDECYGLHDEELKRCMYYAGANDTVITEWLQTYLDNYTGADKEQSDIVKLREEFDIHYTYVGLEQMYFQYAITGSFELYHVLCDYEKLQKKFNHPNPIDCWNLPIRDDNPEKCANDCEQAHLDCISNCDNSSECFSNCSRDFGYCLNKCPKF